PKATTFMVSSQQPSQCGQSFCRLRANQSSRVPARASTPAARKCTLYALRLLAGAVILFTYNQREGKFRRKLMDQLWAPWRLSYVTQPKPPGSEDPCFLCQGLARQEDRANLIVLRRPLTVVVLNRFPYNNGHLLVAPRAHKAALEELGPEELLE